jgi:hypothetical protein
MAAETVVIMVVAAASLAAAGAKVEAARVAVARARAAVARARAAVAMARVVEVAAARAKVEVAEGEVAVEKVEMAVLGKTPNPHLGYNRCSHSIRYNPTVSIAQNIHQKSKGSHNNIVPEHTFAQSSWSK